MNVLGMSRGLKRVVDAAEAIACEEALGKVG